MDEYIKFQNQTAGRDKFFRLIQYTSRIVWGILERKRGNGSDTGVQRAKQLDQVLGLMRRMLRFGRFFETLHSALPLVSGSSSGVSDWITRVTLAMSRISNACYMFLDHVVCLDKLSLLPTNWIHAESWDKLSTKFWLYAILLSLIRDAHELMKIYRENAAVRWRRQSPHPKFHEIENETEGKKGKGSVRIVCWGRIRWAGMVVMEHGDVCVDTAKNLLDVLLPLNSLKFINLPPGVIGCVGVASTLLAALPQINPMIKMVPAS